MKKIVYLTIDDAPSRSMTKRIDWLLEHNVPALFYCRGEMIEKYFDQVVYAIKKGFIIGNHSYSHPYFSQVPYEECITELEKTEELIDRAYKEAGVERPVKIVRFPFGDKGAGFKKTGSDNPQEQEKIKKLDQYLKDNNYTKVVFEGVEPEDPAQLDFIDSYWTLDTLDYKKSLYTDVPKLLETFKKTYQDSGNKPTVILMHNFDHTDHVWEPMMEALLSWDPEFRMPSM